MNRRDFISAAALACSAAAISWPMTAQDSKKLRLAIVGTGDRGTMDWGQPIVEDYGDVTQIVGLCDINGKRVQAAQELIGINAPTFTDFDRMVRETKPDRSPGHHRRCNAFAVQHARHGTGLRRDSEKPMCTNEEQCQAILDAQKRTGRKITVAFNARHATAAKRLKQLLLEKAIGDVISVDFHEYLDTSHGADYFRRWHRLNENSGTLLCHKASHHFDQVNWWLDSRPVEVAPSAR